jgi:hypothetical protein
MLSPNEMVMNTGVTSDPTIMSILTLLNILGAHHMDAVSQGKPCPHCGRMDTEGGDEDGYGCGGRVRGYATGGVSGLFRQSGLFGQPRTPMGRSVPAGSAGGTANGWNYDKNGQVTNYNPSDPWGWLRESHIPTTFGQSQRLLGQAGQMGVFDPRGNQALINSQIEAAQGTKDALVRRNMTAADLGGLDPAQRAVAKLQALRDTGRGVQDISAGIRADAAGRADDFYRNLFNTHVGGDLQYLGGEHGAELERINQSHAQRGQNKHAWQGVLGQALGSAAGGFIGGGGKRP